MHWNAIGSSIATSSREEHLPKRIRSIIFLLSKQENSHDWSLDAATLRGNSGFSQRFCCEFFHQNSEPPWACKHVMILGGHHSASGNTLSGIIWCKSDRSKMFQSDIRRWLLSFFVVWINFWLEQNKPKKSPALVLLFPCEKEERIFETWKQQCNNPSASNSDPRTCLWQWLFYLPLKREKDQLNIENLVPSWSMLGIGSKIFIYLWTNPKTNSKFSGGPNPASFWGVWWAYFFSPFCWVPFKSTTFSVFSRWNRATFCWWLQRSCISVIAAKDFSPQKDINVVEMWHI